MTRLPQVPHYKTRRVELPEVSRVIGGMTTQAASGEPSGTSLKSLPSPLLFGWRVAVKGRWDVEIVNECTWNGMTWIVTLRSGDQIPVSQVLSVGAVDREGNITSAWDVRRHGIDGTR